MEDITYSVAKFSRTLFAIPLCGRNSICRQESAVTEFAFPGFIKLQRVVKDCNASEGYGESGMVVQFQQILSDSELAYCTD